MAQRARRCGGVSGGVPPRDTPPDQGLETRAAGRDPCGEGAAPMPGVVPSASQQGEGALSSRCRGFADVLQVSIGLHFVFPQGNARGLDWIGMFFSAAGICGLGGLGKTRQSRVLPVAS